MSQSRRIPAFLHDNGLLLACLGLFVVFFVGMVVSGAATYNQEQQEHGSQEQVSVLRYLTTGDFVEATFENWESEFLQMGMYVVLTAFLFQRGSSESKPLNEPAPQDQDPREAGTNQWTPWPVRKGGWVLLLHGHRVFRVVLRLVGPARHGRCERVQRGAGAAWGGGDLGVALYDDVAILVRVDAELAERIHRCRGDNRVVDLSAAAGFCGIQAGC